MVYAQVRNNVVVNTIVLDDLTLLPLFSEGFDACIRIDGVSPMPSINWTYIGGVFAPPILETQGEQDGDDNDS